MVSEVVPEGSVMINNPHLGRNRNKDKSKHWEKARNCDTLLGLDRNCSASRYSLGLYQELRQELALIPVLILVPEPILLGNHRLGAGNRTTSISKLHSRGITLCLKVGGTGLSSSSNSEGCPMFTGLLLSLLEGLKVLGPPKWHVSFLLAL